MGGMQHDVKVCHETLRKRFMNRGRLRLESQDIQSFLMKFISGDNVIS